MSMCMLHSMRCYSVMKPFVIIMGVVIVILSGLNLVSKCMNGGERVKKIGITFNYCYADGFNYGMRNRMEQETEMHNENVIQAYCGAGMKEPFAEIISFMKKTA